MLWALVLVVISCPTCSVCITTDSLFSRNVTEAIWGAGRHEQLARLCSSMLLIASQVMGEGFEHVKAHEGNPFNELADCLAKRAAGGVDAPLLVEVAHLLHCHDSETWEWLHGVPHDVRGAYPPLRDGCFVFDEVRSSVSPCCIATDGAGDAGNVSSTDVIACISFGSFNVCTLGDSGSRSKFVAGRPALIKRQVRELGVNLLSVQEARSAAGSRVVDGFVVLASGADKGTLGCGLWADAERPYASIDGKDYCFRFSGFVVIFASPRVLVVRISARCLQCTVVAAHAPHSGVDAAARELWWDDLSFRLAGQTDVVLLVDANARVGSSVSKSVGCGGFCQQEDHGGFLFHRTLVALGLRVPATFGAVDSTAFTWVANGGSAHRIDYVAVPFAWGCDHGTCSRHSVALREVRDVSPSSLHVVDSAADWEDYFLVALRVRLAVRWAPRGAQWKVEGVDRAALKDPACCSRFKEALKSIKPPLWSMSVDEHERFASSAVRRAAKAAFGTPAKRPPREHIDDAAWALICDRRTVKTWCCERRVSAASKGIVPGTPDPLSVYVGLRQG